MELIRLNDHVSEGSHSFTSEILYKSRYQKTVETLLCMREFSCSNPSPEAEILTDEFHCYLVRLNKSAYNNLPHWSSKFHATRLGNSLLTKLSPKQKPLAIAACKNIRCFFSKSYEGRLKPTWFLMVKDTFAVMG